MKKIFLGSVVLALAIASFVWYQSRAVALLPDIAPADEQTIKLAATAPVKGTESFRQLMTKTGDFECAITATGPTTDTLTGTYFTSNGLIRADVMVAGAASGTPERNVTSMVVTPDTLYTWAVIDGEGYGVKSILADQIATAKPEPGKQTPIDFDGQVAYDCKPWEVVDASIFTPPSTIIFKDYSTALEAGMEDGTVYPEAPAGPALTPEDMQSGNPCALCDKVTPGEGQDQCRVNFKCGN
jgi:hypothetical protein